MSDEELVKIAVMARKNAYAPMSKYKVGAALLASSGTVYIGTNVEAPSVITTNCAERVAIQAAYTHGEREFLKLAVVGAMDGNDMLDSTLTPCGTCLQFILEMCKDVDILCYIDGKLKKRKVTSFLTTPYEYTNRK